MPYKDLQQKREWERRHHPERLARRRELRRTEAARKAAQPAPATTEDSGAAFLLPMLAGGALAVHNPKLAMGAGGLTLLIAARYKKDWKWWIVGIFIFALGLFFQRNSKKEKK